VSDGVSPAPTGRAVQETALKGLCPRCGTGSMFAGWVRFAERCPTCGLDIMQFNVGDGPAAFLTLILGALVVGLAVWLEVAVHPPFWVHVLLWVPLSVIGVVASLRVAKGALLALEYQNAAREGRLQ
jgi:uncharacterized protein (DUF983 family)